jgi:hypothetical protein
MDEKSKRRPQDGDQVVERVKKPVDRPYADPENDIDLVTRVWRPKETVRFSTLSEVPLPKGLAEAMQAEQDEKLSGKRSRP